MTLECVTELRKGVPDRTSELDTVDSSQYDTRKTSRLASSLISKSFYVVYSTVLV